MREDVSRRDAEAQRFFSNGGQFCIGNLYSWRAKRAGWPGRKLVSVCHKLRYLCVSA
jgi:hypothetical protein